MNKYEWHLSVKYNPDQPRVPRGQPGGGRWTSGTNVTQRFGNSNVGKTLEALSQDFDFVLAGSAAARLHVGDSRGGEPHDLDVLDLSQKRAEVSKRWDVQRDPRDPSPVYNLIDKKTGVQVQTFESGRQVSRPVEGSSFHTTFRFPYLNEPDGTPNFEEVAGVKVLKPSVLLQTFWDGGRQELIPALIRGLNLSRNYMSARWYQMEFDEVQE